MRNFLLFALASCCLSVNAMAQNLSAQEVNTKTADKIVEAISSRNANLLSEMIIYFTEGQDYNGTSVIDAEQALALISNCSIDGARNPTFMSNSMSLSLSCNDRASVDPCSSGNLFIVITYETLQIGEKSKDTPNCLPTVPPSTRRAN